MRPDRRWTDADALDAAETAAYDATISVIETSLAAARTRIVTARQERRQAIREEAAKLRSALDGAPISDIAATVEHGAPPTMAGTIPGTPPVPVSDLRTEAVAGSASTDGGWSGATYSAGRRRERRRDRLLHRHRGPRRRSRSAARWASTAPMNGLEADGNLPIVAATDATLIASSDFPTGPGIRTHMAGSDGTVEVAGTFDGAEGSYVCTPAMDNGCTSSIRAVGGIALAGGGGWTFVPAEDATVAKTDTEYRYFGWWLRDLGGSYAVGAFHGGVGGGAQDFADLATLQGTASYTGPAAGKFVIDPQLGRRAGRELHRQGDARGRFRGRQRSRQGDRIRGRLRRQRGGGAVVGRARRGRDRRRRDHRGEWQRHRRGHRLVDRRRGQAQPRDRPPGRAASTMWTRTRCPGSRPARSRRPMAISAA